MKQRVVAPFNDVKVLYEIKDFFIMGIISNSPQEVVNFFVSEFDFSDLFKINIGRGNSIWDIEHLKPDPYLFSKLKQRKENNQVYYIGDRESDREFAKRTGMIYYNLIRGVNHSNSFQNLRELVNYLINR
jgi:phosphoglycolate phosphatase